MNARDVICIGASAGGIAALQKLVAGFPPDLRAAVFVVIHIGAARTTHLADVLSAAGPLKVQMAKHLATFERGTIYVGAPDCHLMVGESHMELVRGPKENHNRPAIDPLFRSVAQYHGPKSIGVVLSGLLADGSAGLWAIDRAGGVTVVQTAADAQFPDMPMNAAMHISPDFVAPARELGALVARIAHSGFRKGSEPNEIVEAENAAVRGETLEPDAMNLIGTLRPFICPECSGPMWQMKKGPTRFRCHVGHAYASENLLEDHSRTREATLWSAARLLREQAALIQTQIDTGTRSPAVVERLQQAALQARTDAEVVNSLLSGKSMAVLDPITSDEVG